MERFGLFRFQRLQFFLLAIIASDIAERSSGSLRIRIETRRRILRRRGRTIIFLRTLVSLGFNLRAILRSQNLAMLEIFFSVNMRGGLLRFLFSGAFPPSGFGDALFLLVLRAGNGCAKSCKAQEN